MKLVGFTFSRVQASPLVDILFRLCDDMVGGFSSVEVHKYVLNLQHANMRD